MPAYVIAMMTVTDSATYKKYTDRTPPTVKKYGGRFLTRGGPITCAEGQAYTGRMVILEFPHKAAAEAWIADPSYQDAVAFRQASSTMHHLLIQEGGGNTLDPDPNL